MFETMMIISAAGLSATIAAVIYCLARIAELQRTKATRDETQDCIDRINYAITEQQLINVRQISQLDQITVINNAMRMLSAALKPDQEKEPTHRGNR